MEATMQRPRGNYLLKQAQLMENEHLILYHNKATHKRCREDTSPSLRKLEGRGELLRYSPKTGLKQLVE